MYLRKLMQLTYSLFQNFLKNIARILFDVSIYPTQDEFREATETFLKDDHSDFLKKFKKNQWILYYERNIYQSVS